jgi:hypothetical protein
MRGLVPYFMRSVMPCAMRSLMPCAMRNLMFMLSWLTSSLKQIIIFNF